MPTGHKLTPDMLASVRRQACRKLKNIGKAHGFDHALRVEAMALDFISDSPETDLMLVSLFALLHDVDDYKLFPGSKGGTPNADIIMAGARIPFHIQELFREQIARFGYSRRLKGLCPSHPAAMAVSDADMCDIMGATGIARLVEYDIQSGAVFFDPDDMPAKTITHEGYMSTQTESGCRHMFDKILLLPSHMLTKKGRAEALERRETTAMYLRALFREQHAAKWSELLEEYLNRPV